MDILNIKEPARYLNIYSDIQLESGRKLQESDHLSYGVPWDWADKPCVLVQVDKGTSESSDMVAFFQLYKETLIDDTAGIWMYASLEVSTLLVPSSLQSPKLLGNDVPLQFDSVNCAVV